MTVKYSYKLLNDITAGKGVRSALEDFILTVKDGTVPTNCEDARTGTTLAVFTNNGNSVASTDRSTPKVYTCALGTGFAANNTVKANLTIEGAAVATYTYTIPATANTDLKVAMNVARMLNDIPQLQAICQTNAILLVAGRVAGLNFTLADGGGSYNLTPTVGLNQTRVDALQFGNAANGVISKAAADVWKCNAANANGTAGYWTIHTPDDANLGADANYAYKRIQGTLATVGGDITIDPATIVANATVTINNFTITLPVSKTT